MCITATQIIDHYSVNLIQFKNLSKCWLYNNWIVFAKNFKAIASVVLVVGLTTNCKQFFSNICMDFVKWLWVTAAWMIIHHSINFIPIIIPSKQSTFKKGVVSGKNFKAIWSVVYPAGMTKDSEHFQQYYHP